MKTVINLPTADLLKVSAVHMDLDINGDQHDRLVMGSEQNFERVMLSVLDELMDEDAYSLPLAVNVSLFLAAKIQSLGYNWSIDWKCPNMIGTKNNPNKLVQCGHSNKFELNANELKWKDLPKNYKYPRRSFQAPDEKTYEVYNACISIAIS